MQAFCTTQTIAASMKHWLGTMQNMTVRCLRTHTTKLHKCVHSESVVQAENRQGPACLRDVPKRERPARLVRKPPLVLGHDGAHNVQAKIPARNSAPWSHLCLR